MCGREEDDQQGEVAIVVLDPEDEEEALGEMSKYGRFPNDCRCDPRNCPCPVPLNSNFRCYYNAGPMGGPRKPSPSPPPPQPPPGGDPGFQYYGDGPRKPSPSPPPPPPPGDPDQQYYGDRGPGGGPQEPPPPPPGGMPYGNGGSRRHTPSPPPPPPPGDPNPQYYGGGGGGPPKPMPSPPPSPPPMNQYPNQPGPYDNQKPIFSPQPNYPYGPPPPSGYPPRRRPHPTSTGPSHLFALAATLLLFLIGLLALILYLIYRPSSPRFSLTSASIFLLNTTNPHPTTTPAAATCFIATTMQFTLLANNPSRKASLHYDDLVATLAYCNGQVIAPPSKLPAIHQGKRSTVSATIVIGGGGEAVPVPPGLVQAMVADVGRGVMGLRLVVEGKARYKMVGGVIKSGHYRVSVRCDLAVGVGAVLQRSVYGGQVPLLGDPKCTVDI